MSPEFQAIELLNKKLEGEEYDSLKPDITDFLVRAQRELTPEDHEKFRETLSQTLTGNLHAFHAVMSFNELFGSNIGLKVDFNKFVGTDFKLNLDSNRPAQEAVVLEAYNVGDEPEEQSSPEAVPSGSAEMCTESSNSNLSSLSENETGNENEAAPTTFEGIVPDPSAE